MYLYATDYKEDCIEELPSRQMEQVERDTLEQSRDWQFLYSCQHSGLHSPSVYWHYANKGGEAGRILPRYYVQDDRVLQYSERIMTSKGDAC